MAGARGVAWRKKHQLMLAIVLVHKEYSALELRHQINSLDSIETKMARGKLVCNDVGWVSGLKLT